jgi:hypothetical protein
MLLAAALTFLLVYSPHFNYPFPYHIDEWHHITEAMRLQRGEYPGNTIGYRIGFHIILLLLSKIVGLVKIYQFLPAIWAVVSALALFYVIYKKTGGKFYTALAAMIFFASIKSNVNITGLWFFTPLSFSIPFIFLYVFFFTEGVEKQNRKFILTSFLIMVILLPIHAISVLFAIPFLLIYSLCHLGYIRKEWRLFSLSLVIPVIGSIFYKFMSRASLGSLLEYLGRALQFKKGWGILELNNSPFELYSPIGCILAFWGLIIILADQKTRKRYLAYVLWPITVLVAIAAYRITGISYLCPYQRNLYYFAIGLPFLSAFSLDYLLEKQKGLPVKMAILYVIMALAFKNYYDIPRQVELYRVIDNDDYKALQFLSAIPQKSKVMAIPSVSEALYPISGHWPVATYAFYGVRLDAERFFSPLTSLEERLKILKGHNVKYVLSKVRFDYGWKTLYQDNGYYIYQVK